MGEHGEGDDGLTPASPTPEHLLGLSILPGGQYLADYFRDERNRKQEQVLETISESMAQLGESVEEVLERVQANPPRRRLLNETLRAAYETEHAEKLRWLGYLLASGLLLADDAQVDEIERVVQTIGRLDPVDVRVLHLIRTPANPEMRTRDEGDRYVPTKELLQRYPQAERVMDSVLATLQREGLIFDRGGQTWDGNVMWVPTQFGHLLLQTLQEAGHAEVLAGLPDLNE